MLFLPGISMATARSPPLLLVVPQFLPRPHHKYSLYSQLWSEAGTAGWPYLYQEDSCPPPTRYLMWNRVGPSTGRGDRVWLWYLVQGKLLLSEDCPQCDNQNLVAVIHPPPSYIQKHVVLFTLCKTFVHCYHMVCWKFSIHLPQHSIPVLAKASYACYAYPSCACDVVACDVVC